MTARKSYELLEHDEITLGAMARRKAVPGVYFLIRESTIVYVGQSLWVYARLCEHIRAKKIPFDSYFVQRCTVAELAPLESRYIAKFRPRHNKTLRHDRSHLDPEALPKEARRLMESEAAKIAEWSE